MKGTLGKQLRLEGFCGNLLRVELVEEVRVDQGPEELKDELMGGVGR